MLNELKILKRQVESNLRFLEVDERRAVLKCLSQPERDELLSLATTDRFKERFYHLAVQHKIYSVLTVSLLRKECRVRGIKDYQPLATHNLIILLENKDVRELKKRSRTSTTKSGNETSS